MLNQIILVDENDREIGAGEKMEVHLSGKLHRAFSIFVFNSDGHCCFKKELKPSIIAADCGQTPAAAIRDRAKKQKQRPIGG